MDEITCIEIWRSSSDKAREEYWAGLENEDRMEIWKNLDVNEKHDFVLTEYGLEFGIKMYHSIKEKQSMSFPGLSGLLIYLELSDDDYEAMLDDPRFSKWFTYARRRRSQFLENLSLTKPNTATACKLLLSQPENGGYGDKAPEKKPKMMTVTLRGIDDDNSANSSDN